jgi:hypothetical protein
MSKWAQQILLTLPWRGRVGERAQYVSRGGVNLELGGNHPTPLTPSLCSGMSDPPPPGEGGSAR